MKKVIEYLSFLAILAIVPLQMLWVAHTYNEMRTNMYNTIDECFKKAMEEELMNRIDSIRAEQTIFIEMPRGGTGISTNRFVELSSMAETYHSKRNYYTIGTYFVKELALKNIYGLNFLIGESKTDNLFKKIARNFVTVHWWRDQKEEIYTSDPTVFDREEYFAKKGSKEFRTHIIPVNTDFSMGAWAIIKNPYKAILNDMWELVVSTFIIIVFVVFCLVKQVNIIRRQRAIAKMRQDHTYAMIHDMKTPLSSISLISKSLNNNSLGDNEQLKGEYLTTLITESKHLLDLCNKVLAIAKLEQKRLKFETSRVIIQPVFESLAEKYKVENSDRKINFIIDCSKGKYFDTDKDYLFEALENLIENSIKYSGNDVKIELSSELKNNYMQISVKDNGRGIPEENLKKVFDIFERGDNVTEGSGHGIGLNFVYQIVRGQGGDVKIYSELNKFTNVILMYPLKHNIL
jgi:two-component system phosphate regulon sensor histidine kinase PhoR